MGFERTKGTTWEERDTHTRSRTRTERERESSRRGGGGGRRWGGGERAEGVAACAREIPGTCNRCGQVHQFRSKSSCPLRTALCTAERSQAMQADLAGGSPTGGGSVRASCVRC